MNREPTTVEKLGALPWSIAADSANAVFVQFTFFGSVFILFLSELGLSKSQMGFLLSLIPFSGLVALFIAPSVARFGYKRTFLTFFGLRKMVTAFLLLTPWVASVVGAQGTTIFVAIIVAIFALCRATAETGKYPWLQEYIPNNVRGKYAATSNIFTTLVGLLAITIAGLVIGRTVGLNGFTLLIAAGVVFGLISVWAHTFIPGGAPREIERGKAYYHALIEALRDKDFFRYLTGAALITLATTPLGSFLPLFMQDQVGLNSGNVVHLQTGTLLGGLLSGYVWGWAADRYGSKPVMLSGGSVSLLLPLLWMVMPRHADLSLYIALGIAFLQGFANMGWGIGSTRLLFVSIVPAEKKTDYMALYYTWIGVIGGLSQLIGGRVLDYSQAISGQFFIFNLDPFTPLFIGGMALPLLSILLLRGVRADTAVGVGEFAGLFLRGNPFLAAESLIRYHLAKDEHATVLVTERLGKAKSLLTVDELLEALADPRFNVRFEAIISIARLRPDQRLIKALVDILESGEPSLGVVAAWALGRLGDERAREPLRAALDSNYRSIKAHSSRALGTLEDTEVIPLLLQRLVCEPDYGLRIAYASALGKLGAQEATGELLALLYNSLDESARMELALAVARIVGHEHYFIQLLRQARGEMGTITSQAISALKRKLDKVLVNNGQVDAVLDECADTLAREELEEGLALMSRLLRLLPEVLPEANFSRSSQEIIAECAARTKEFGASRIEYVLLALHTLNVGWQPAS
jgi:MFS family permease